MKLSRIFSNLVIVGACLISAAAYAQPAAQQNPTAPANTNAAAPAPITLASAATSAQSAQQTQIEGVVRNYLIKNPDVIIQALQVYQQKQMEQARDTIQKTQQTSPQFADALFHQPSDPIAGNPNGKVTLVEFFDYQCPHCVDMAPAIKSLIEKNSNLRVVFKEFPIRGPVSEIASKAALAANKQGKYLVFHEALMNTKKSPLTEADIYAIAQTVGLNVDQLKADMQSAAVTQQIKATYKLAQDLQLLGTPAIFVAKTDVTKNTPATAITFIPGQIDQTQLEGVIGKIGG